MILPLYMFLLSYTFDFPGGVCGGVIPSQPFNFKYDKYFRFSNCQFDNINNAYICDVSTGLQDIDAYLYCEPFFSQLYVDNQQSFQSCYVYIYENCLNDAFLGFTFYLDCYDDITEKSIVLEYSDICNVLPNIKSKGGKNVQKNDKGAFGFGRLSGNK